MHHLGALDQLSQLHMLTIADISNEAAQAADAATQAATEVVQPRGGGPFDFLAGSFESLLKMIDGGLEAAHVPYSYGFAIIILTVLVKVATFPLTKKQVESTMAVQALQPRVKDLQAKYSNDPERLQLETGRLYKDAQVNPLAGCLPTLATIPVFIGLYRALTLAAQDGLLSEGFFFIPSLGGPATIEQQLAGQGMSWLFPFVDGQPPLGWQVTAAYLVLPVLLVISQSASMKIMQPQSATDDPSVQQTQAILKWLPLLIGYFSLNVPSGLTIYWLTNNILTTGQQVWLKKTVKIDVPAPKGTVVNAPQTIDVKAGPSGAEMGARRSKKGEKFRARQAAETSDSASTIAQNARKKQKGNKFAERKKAETDTVDVKAGKASDKGDVVVAESTQASADGSSNGSA